MLARRQKASDVVILEPWQVVLAYVQAVSGLYLAPTFFSRASIVKLLGRSMGNPKARDQTPYIEQSQRVLCT